MSSRVFIHVMGPSDVFALGYWLGQRESDP